MGREPRDTQELPEGPARRHEALPAEVPSSGPRCAVALAFGRPDGPPLHPAFPYQGAQHKTRQVRPRPLPEQTETHRLGGRGDPRWDVGGRKGGPDHRPGR